MSDHATRRLIERGTELAAGNEADRRVALLLFTEARDRASATMRDLENAHPALKAIGRAMRDSQYATYQA